MNIAVPKSSQPGTVACCYRITLAGQRALRRLDKRADDEDEVLNEAAFRHSWSNAWMTCGGFGSFGYDAASIRWSFPLR